MNTENKRFVLSDSNIINSKGFKVDINGLDISRFATNPMMLYEHNPEKVIGRWLDIKKEEQKLTALPEFDMVDEESLRIAGKVERGFLNAASIGIIVHDITIVDGVDVVTRSELFEASIVSVPSDSGAVRLYNEKMECLTIDKLKLNINNKKDAQMDFEVLYKEVCEALVLEPDADIKVVLEAIRKLSKTSGEAEIEEALRLDILTVSEHHHYLKLLRGGQSSVLSIIEEKRKDFETKQNTQLLDLYNENSDKIITYLGLDGWKEAKHLGFERLKKIVDNLPERQYFAKMVKTDATIHDLNWYRKHNPKALRDNPELYQSLLHGYKQENQTKN